MTDRDTETFVEQVEEEVRRERWAAFWKKWGLWIGGAAGAVVLGVASWEGYKLLSTSQAASSSEAFLAARAKVDTDREAAQAALAKISETGPGAYRVAALMERAALLEESGDLKGALVAFDEAAKRAEDRAFKASIQLRAAFIAADLETFDAVETRLKPVIDGAGPYGLLGRKVLAVEAMEAGKTDAAVAALNAIVESLDDLTVQLPPPAEGMPPQTFSLQEWARGMLSVLTPTGGESVKPSPEPAKATPGSGAAAGSAQAGDKK